MSVKCQLCVWKESVTLTGVMQWRHYRLQLHGWCNVHYTSDRKGVGSVSCVDEKKVQHLRCYAEAPL